MENNFKTSLGTISKVITCLLILLGLIIPIIALSDKKPDADIATVVIIIPVLFTVLLGVTFIYMPQSYTVSLKGITIIRRAKNVLIHANEIVNVKKVPDEQMGFPLRLFGNGGLFGFTGYYSSFKMGRMRWYATKRGNYVLITTKAGKKIIITPNDPDLLIQSASKILIGSVA